MVAQMPYSVVVDQGLNCFALNEPHHVKYVSSEIFDQVSFKPACSATEAS